MAIDKRAIISNKRARNKRKKAMRASAKALAAALAESSRPECDGGMTSPTATDSSGIASGDESVPTAVPVDCPVTNGGETTLAVHLTLADSTEEHGERVHDNQQDSDEDDEDEDGDYDDEEDDGELVFVCRPTMQDFCTEFVAPADAKGVSAAGDLRKFTVRIPAFRETREGFITYTIAISTCGESRQQFQLERRYSEFVAFATELDLYLRSDAHRRLREERRLQEEGELKQNDDETPTRPEFQWELPPKTWFRMTQVTALEERRSKLEVSLLALLAHDPSTICHVPLVRDFLMLDIFGAQVVEEKLQHHA